MAMPIADPSLKPVHSLSSSDIVISQDAAPSIGKASNDSSLVRSILAAFGKEILEPASDQFLDLALELRLETINARDLVISLAKANRLGYSETDIIDEETIHQAHEGSRSRLDAISAPKPPSKRRGQVRSASTTSPQPSAIEESREPKRLKAIQVHERESISVKEPPNTLSVRAPCPGTPLEKQDACSSEGIQVRVGMREQNTTSARSAGKHGQRHGTTVGASTRVRASVPQSGNVLKRPRIQPDGVCTKSRHRRHVPSSAARQSLGASAAHTDLVVISDSEPESDDDNDN